MGKDFIVTYTGVEFYPLKSTPEDINAIDIAHSLSLMCRANGHMIRFFSVAQHSINCYYEAVARGYSKRVQLGCLLHDGSEAYISDITRPVKTYLDTYRQIEEKVQSLVYARFGLGDLTEEELEQIKICDDIQLSVEFKELHEHTDFECDYEPMGKADLSNRDPEIVKEEFLKILNRLLEE